MILKILKPLLIFFFLLQFSITSGLDDTIKVRFIKRFNNATAGQKTALQVYINNQSSRPIIMVGHLNLPPYWKVIPANDVLIHLMPNQNIIQTLALKIPDYEKKGEFPISYEVQARDNPNIYNKDSSTMIVKPSIPYTPRINECFPPVEYLRPADELEVINPNDDYEFKKNSKLHSKVSISTTSEKHIIATGNETVFISYFIKNESDKYIKDCLSLSLPMDWLAIPTTKIDVEIPPGDTFLQIFALKVPKNVSAGRYIINAELENLSLESTPIFIEIPYKVQLKIQSENIASYYPINESIDLDVNLKNQGNTPLSVRMEAVGDPHCNLIYRQTPMFIPAQNQYLTTLHIEPNLRKDDEKQFILLKAIDNSTSEILYKDTITLCFTPPDYDENTDPYLRIPAHMSMIALGENSDNVFAFEWGGGGIVDPERERYIEFLFRLPTNSRNVIYSVDQCIYFGVEEPDWSIDLGDTVYSLSPLTQRYRYGRGAGFDVEKEKFSFGAHYTQNIFNNDYNPKETCGYVGFNPTNRLYISGNYLHRDVQEEPTSNLVSIASEYELTKRIHTELELGKNLVNHAGHHDTSAFRFDMRGEIYKDTWFDIEKIYAGPAFFGYYNNVNTFSSVIDFPLCSRVRANISTGNLKQNYVQGYHAEDSYAIRQRQRQYNANISYNFSSGASFTLNGLLLRAWDHGENSQYNFYQQWGGFTTSYNLKGWSLVNIVSYGRQIDYLTHNIQPFLQRYWCYASKQLTENLYSSVFYEGGNTNYYDAKPWRNTIGTSIRYRYSLRGYGELFLQRVNNKPDMYELNQISFVLSHTFRNGHYLDVSSQYFNYQTHYPNDFLFLVSYTIPFSMRVGKRRDIGTLSGHVHDVYHGIPIPKAMVNVGGKQSITDADGNFTFKNLKTGTHNLKIEMLPKQMITQSARNQSINVIGGENTQITIPIISTCSINGEIVLYTYRDPIEIIMMNQDSDLEAEMVKKGSLPEIRIVIESNDSEEVYTSVTNEKGFFYFNNLRPGKWNIYVNTDQLPDRYYLKTNNLSLDLKPNEHQEITFDVLPIPQKILPLD